MPGRGGSSSTMAMSNLSQQNYRMSEDSTDGPYNNNPYLNTSNNTQMLNRSLNYTNSSVNNNLTTTNSNNDQNNNPNSMVNNNPPNGIGHEATDGTPIGLGTSRRDLFAEIRNGGGHWSQLLRQVVLSSPSNIRSSSGVTDRTDGAEERDADKSFTALPIQIQGGSENGHFAVVGHMNPDINEWIAVGYLQPGDILLDIQGQQVAGYTQADVLSLLHHCLHRNTATLTVAPRGNLGPELRSYLNTRFQKGSVDHALQGVVRDNLYLRTVPVTTRPPRPGEIPGVDYTFLSVEEFMELERNGSLLESGVYAGNHYGTPKPWARKLRSTNSQINNSEENQAGCDSKITILPGMHPSSEGKRRRNRSNVEALGASDDDPPSPNINNSAEHVPTSYSSSTRQHVDELGPLPANWEMSYTEKGEVYFIDHNTGTSHWLDPRLSRVQKTTLEDCADNELPFGWERIEDPHYGTYYIDHVNRRTQFENPVLQAKSKTSHTNDSSTSESEPKKSQPKGIPPIAPPKPSSHRLSIPREKTPVFFPMDEKEIQQHPTSLRNHQSSIPNSSSSSVLRVKSAGGRVRHNFFTRDPEKLVGERIQTVLLKSPRGLGFTIVGGDDDDGLDEFLQIKSVVTDGPAWRDGKLRTGDVLVRVNRLCVLGYTHQEMVSIFQSIGPGEEVELEVCRGYPLPFDPADPNTEIVTTVAVAPISSTDSGDKRQMDWTGRTATPDSVAHSAHSLPELSTDRAAYGKSNVGRPASVDLLLDSPMQSRAQMKVHSKSDFDSGIFLTTDIIKGTGGFGFTIADSVTGQKVKKVLDATHCGGLEEGDRLIAIDGIDLRSLSHTQVVQILKDFPLGKGACLTIQRLHSTQEYKLNSEGSSHYSDSRLITQRSGAIPRSKTPTADLGRTRPKLRDSLPERPKTPLLDSSGHFNGELQQPIGHSGQHPFPYLTDRYSTSLGGLPSNHEPNFAANDLNQLPVIRDWREMTIELHRRQEGFGFRIVGGTEEGSQVSVGHIVPRGAAYIDGRLQTNDQIVAVDGVSVIDASHHSVVQLMARSAAIGRVHLAIRRPIYGTVGQSTETDGIRSPEHSPSGSVPVHGTLGSEPKENFTTSVPLHVTLRRQASEGFGFVIISSAAKAGATIGRIVEGSPADRCGQVNVGDRILAVNQIDISQLHHSQVVQLIKDSGLILTLSFLPASLTNEQDSTLAQFSQSRRTTMSINDLENLNLKESGFDMGTAFISPESHSVHFGSNNPGSMSFQDEGEEVFPVQLTRGNRGFGFSIRGGKEFQNMPLFVLRLADDGPAAIDGRMQVGDQILQINGFNTQGMTHAQAIHIIKAGDMVVHLMLRRGAESFFLGQIPNFSSGFGSVNGQEEEQSVSSNNDPQQFVNQSSPMYRDHLGTYPSQS